MSNYVVLYHYEYTEQVLDAPNHYFAREYRERSFSKLAMKKFDDEQKAINFSKKNDGVILVPATINSKIVAPKETKS